MNGDPGRRLAVLLNKQQDAPPPYMVVRIGQVDTTAGTAEVVIEGTDENLQDVPYTGQWLPAEGESALLTRNGSTPLLVASAEDDFNPTFGGRMEVGAGRPLQYNGDFNAATESEGLEGWEVGEGATFYLFDTATDSWAVASGGASGTLTWVDGANNPQFAQNKGAVRVAATLAGDLTVQSPANTTVSGRQHRGSIYTKFDNREGRVAAVIRWFSDTAGTTLVSESIGPEVIVSATRWDSVQIEAVAPPNAVRARIAVRFFDVASTTIARIDTSFLGHPANATIAREMPPVSQADSFTRADSPVTTGAPVTWTLTGAGTWRVEDNYVRCSSRGGGINAIRVDTTSVDHSVTLAVRAPFSIGQGLVWRYITFENHWRVEITAFYGTAIVFTVFRRVGGVDTAMGTFNFVPTKGAQQFTIRALNDVGNWQSVYVNGVRGWYINTTIHGAATQVGILAHGAGSTATFDDFKATTIGAHIYDGTPTLRITSLAAGMASARTPRTPRAGEETWAAASEGFVVHGGEWYLMRFRARNNILTPGRIISFAMVYFDANSAFVGVQFAPPITPTTDWMTCQQATPVPSGVTYMRAYVGFIAQAAGERIYVDSLSVQRCSVVVQPIMMTAPEGRARIETIPSNTVQQRWWPTDDPADEPGVIMVESASMTVAPPRHKTANKPSVLIIPADSLDFRQGGTSEWTLWTPSLTGGGWALGNGSIVGRWYKIGSMVVYSWLVTFGSTSTYGGDPLGLTAPFRRRTGGTATLPVGSLGLHDTSGDVMVVGTVAIRANPGGGPTQAMRFAITSGFGLVQASTPFAWATGDLVFGTITYEAENASVVPL